MERIPPLAAPCLTNSRSFQQTVAQIRQPQSVTYAQSGPACTYHYRIKRPGRLHDLSSFLPRYFRGHHNCQKRDRGRAAMSGLGQSRRFWHVRATSAFPLIATEERTSRDVSNVPLTDSCVAANSISNRQSFDRAACGISIGRHVLWKFSRLDQKPTQPVIFWPYLKNRQLHLRHRISASHRLTFSLKSNAGLHSIMGGRECIYRFR